MREIKFRQPTFRKGEFIDFHYWGFIKHESLSDYIFVSPIGNNKTYEEIMNLSQQFTGLKDKNKKEVYVGDIIRVPSDCGIIGGCKDCGDLHSPEWHEVIKFGKFKDAYEDDNEELIGFYVETYDKGKKTYHLIPSMLKEKFIVGNIYQNPELLKEVKQ